MVVHVVADAAALDAQPDPHTSGERASRPITSDMTLAEALAPDPEPDIPAVKVARSPPHRRRHYTRVDGGRAGPQRRHNPTAAPSCRCATRGRGCAIALGSCGSIRCRDMTCRFPGCDRPAEFTDIDHTIPYPLADPPAQFYACVESTTF